MDGSECDGGEERGGSPPLYEMQNMPLIINLQKSLSTIDHISSIAIKLRSIEYREIQRQIQFKPKL